MPSNYCCCYYYYFEKDVILIFVCSFLYLLCLFIGLFTLVFGEALKYSEKASFVCNKNNPPIYPRTTEHDY